MAKKNEDPRAGVERVTWPGDSEAVQKARVEKEKVDTEAAQKKAQQQRLPADPEATNPGRE